MTWEELGAIGDLVGGIAVIISLVYVGLQIRQSANASRAATSQAFAKQYSDVNQMIADPAIARIFAKGLDGMAALTVDEQASFAAILSSISRTLESFYFQRRAGDLDPVLFDGWFTQYLDLHANAGVGEFWSLRKHQFSPDFVDDLAREMSSRAAKPLYAADSAATE